MKPINGILIHDGFSIEGGAEKVVADLASYFNWEVITGYKPQGPVSGLLKTINVICPESTGKQLLVYRFSKILYYIDTFLNYSGRTDYELVVFSGEVSLLCAPRFNCRKILYCHTPPRVLYDLKDFILKNEKNLLKQIILRIILLYFKKNYEQSLDHIDTIIANSENVQNRIKKFLKKNAALIYPPVDTKRFYFNDPENYYLSTARLTPFKRVTKIIEAFLEMPDKELIILSDGDERTKIETQIKNVPNIIYRGWVTNREKEAIISRCIATVYIPIDEDFGMSPVESMAAGKPVIGVMEGGLLETVIHRKTGILIKGELTKEKIMNAVRKLDPKTSIAMKNDCIKQAALFSKQIFFDNFSALIKPV